MSIDPRTKLHKKDMPLLVERLQTLGYEVHAQKSGGRVSAYLPSTKEYVCGFTWQKPGGWVFDIALCDVNTHLDIRTVTNELLRIRTLRTALKAAWLHFMTSQSDKRWLAYRGVIAALFARAPIQEDPPDE